MSEGTIEIQRCEYCQEDVPIDIGTDMCVQGCNNSLCPYDVYEDTNREKPLNFNEGEVDRDEQIDYSGLVEDSESGC